MKKLWLAFIVLATLGSIYPFNFQLAVMDAATIGRFLHSCCGTPGRGDILGNVILFVPIGFTGMLAIRPEESASRRFIFVCLVGFVIALALQLMQIFLPSRDANLQDVMWNLFGMAGGAALARAVRFVTPHSEQSRTDVSLVPMTLVGTWLIYRLIPFVPSLDFQLIKDSLKPAFNLQWSPVNSLHDATAWLVVAYLLRSAQRGVRLDAYLPALIAIVFCLEVLIVDNSISLSNVVGAALAYLLWRGVLRFVLWQENVLAISLLCTLLVAGLAPFELRSESVPFNWLPFHGFLGGAMSLNTQSAAEKVFMYGSLVYILWRTRIGAVAGIFISLSFVIAVEVAQTRFLGHVPEITDPLLVVFAAIALLLLEGQDKNLAFVGHRTAPLDQSKIAFESCHKSKRYDRNWVNLTVNFRGNQLEFLSNLSEEMGISISGATRRIVAVFIKRLGRDENLAPWVEGGHSITELIQDDAANLAVDDSRADWARHSINLRRKQFLLLDGLAQEMGVSTSRVTRRIVAQFIDGLGSDESDGGS